MFETIKSAKQVVDTAKVQSDKIKKHVMENKTAYIAGAVGLASGAAGSLLTTQGVVVNDSFKLLTVYLHSPVTNEVTTQLARRGNPGYIVKCVETGEVFASQARAAAAYGVNPVRLSEHLNGARNAVKGMHFERLAEAL